MLQQNLNHKISSNTLTQLSLRNKSANSKIKMKVLRKKQTHLLKNKLQSHILCSRNLVQLIMNSNAKHLRHLDISNKIISKCLKHKVKVSAQRLGMLISRAKEKELMYIRKNAIILTQEIKSLIKLKKHQEKGRHKIEVQKNQTRRNHNKKEIVTMIQWAF